MSTPSKNSKLQDLPFSTLSPKLEFDDGDIDDELDPAMKEQLDRLDGYINVDLLKSFEIAKRC